MLPNARPRPATRPARCPRTTPSGSRPQDLDPLVDVPDGGRAVRLARVRPRDDPRLRPRRVGALLRPPCWPCSAERTGAIWAPSGATSRSTPTAGRSRATCTSRSSPPPATSWTRSTAPASRPASPTTARPARARVRTGLLRRLPARPRRQQRRGRQSTRADRTTGAIDHLWLRTRDLARTLELLRGDRRPRRRGHPSRCASRLRARRSRS